MSFETDFDTAFSILLGKAVGVITPTGVTVTPTPVSDGTTTTIATARVVDVPMVIGGRGTALATSDHVFYRLGLNGTLTVLTWSLAGTVSGASIAGTITVDILVGSTLATVATICGGNKPTLTAQAERSDQAPATDWTTSIADPRWIMAKVISTAGALEVVSLTLRCLVT